MMMNNLWSLIFLFLVGCNGIEPQTEVKLEKDTLLSDSNNEVKSEHLTAIELKSYAKLILADSIRPSDNNNTFQLLDSLNSNNKKARDYYFQVFQNISTKSDGALSEVMGIYAQEYIENYTNEFFDRYDCCDTLKSCCENLIRIAHFVQYEIGMQNDVESSYYTFLDKIEKGKRKYPNDHLMILFIDNLTNGMDQYLEK